MELDKTKTFIVLTLFSIVLSVVVTLVVELVRRRKAGPDSRLGRDRSRNGEGDGAA